MTVFNTNRQIIFLQHNRGHGPCNYNLKKHMVRLAFYELAKFIAPNNGECCSNAR